MTSAVRTAAANFNRNKRNQIGHLVDVKAGFSSFLPTSRISFNRLTRSAVFLTSAYSQSICNFTNRDAKVEKCRAAKINDDLPEGNRR